MIQFTNTEDTGLRVWLDLENAGLEDQAASFLNKALLFEHYLSQLPNDPTKRTPEQLEQLETYRRDFEDALDLANTALRAVAITTPSTKYCDQCGARIR